MDISSNSSGDSSQYESYDIQQHVDLSVAAFTTIGANSPFNVSSFVSNGVSSIEDISGDKLNYIINKLEELDFKFNIEKEKNNLLNDKHNSLLSKYNKILKKNNNIINDLYDIKDELFSIDCRVIHNEQYSRRECLVISGIPDNVLQPNLENTVLQILKLTGIRDVSSYHVTACHRLKNNRNNRFPAKTIIKFTNRKIVDLCLKSKEKVINNKPLNLNLRFYESLCKANEQILAECIKLRNYGLINEYVIRNGFIKISRNNNNLFTITHPDILYDLFHEFYDYENLYSS